MRDGALVVRCVSTPPPQPSPRSLRRSGLGVRDVVLVSGATSRTRIVNVPDSAAPLVAGLRDGWAESDRWTRSGPTARRQGAGRSRTHLGVAATWVGMHVGKDTVMDKKQRPPRVLGIS